MTTTTTKKATTKKAPVKKTATKEATPTAAKKEVAPTAAKKEATKKVPAKEPNTPRKEREVADQTAKEIRWTQKKIDLFAAFKAAGAVSEATAKRIEEIAEAGGLAVAAARHQVNPKFDLTVQEYIGSAVIEGARATCYFLTKKGQSKKFD